MADTTKKGFNPFRFFGEVRQEGRKVTWTTWRETAITTVMVFIMVAFAAVFFFVVDSGISLTVQFLLSFFG
jgi:preprotein translocase subunit SecE